MSKPLISQEKIDKYLQDGAFKKRYKKRAGIFQITRLTFNPKTGDAYSYEWYKLAGVYKGKLVLNVHPFSSTTAKHVSRMRGLLQGLGVDYVVTHAPRGLQDTGLAKKRMLALTAAIAVKFKYGRQKYPIDLRLIRSKLSVLTLLGEKVSFEEIRQAVAQAKENRRQRLSEERQKRFQKSMEKLNVFNQTAPICAGQGRSL